MDFQLIIFILVAAVLGAIMGYNYKPKTATATIKEAVNEASSSKSREMISKLFDEYEERILRGTAQEAVSIALNLGMVVKEFMNLEDQTNKMDKSINKIVENSKFKFENGKQIDTLC